MKTDKILQLIQQKKAMRSGGALPLPKAQAGLNVPRSFYDPYTDEIHLAAGDETNPEVVEHELYHRYQNVVRDASRVPEYYPGPLKKPVIPTDPETPFVSDYYNRRPVEVEMIGQDWISRNPSFSFIAPELVYNKVIDPSLYNYGTLPAYLEGDYPFPYTIEEEATAYENAVAGGLPRNRWLPDSLRYDKGGDTVSELWKKVTGSDWSQAKKLGLTDGSYEQNMKLRNKLVSSPEYRALVSPRPQAERPRMSVPSRVSTPANSYRVQMPNMTAASDATRVAPSGRKAEYEYYSQQPFGTTDPNSTVPRDIQLARMAATANQDQIRQTSTGPRKAIQDVYRSATSTNNDLANMVTGVLGYPVQAGLNIANTVMGDTPIRSDADVAALGMDALALIPAARSLYKIGSSGILPAPPPKPSNIQRFMADETRYPGLEVIRRGKRGTAPSSVTVIDKRITGPGNYVKAVRNPKTGEYSFQFDMSDAANPRRSGLAIDLLRNQFGRGYGFQETSTMSLDSYRNLLGMSKNKRYDFTPSGTTILNTQASNAKFLDDLADPYFSRWDEFENLSPARQARISAWDDAGSKMMFSTKAKAEEAAKRINEQYLGKFGLREQAMPVKGDGRKWNVSIPNFQLMQRYKSGGSLRVRVKIKKQQ